MPKVPVSDNILPFTSGPSQPMPSQTDFAMAAATMHAQGRLFDKMEDMSIPAQRRESIEDYNKSTDFKNKELPEEFKNNKAFDEMNRYVPRAPKERGA